MGELIEEQVERELELDVSVCDNELVHGEVQVVERAAKIEGFNFAFNLALPNGPGCNFFLPEIEEVMIVLGSRHPRPFWVALHGVPVVVVVEVLLHLLHLGSMPQSDRFHGNKLNSKSGNSERTTFDEFPGLRVEEDPLS